MLSGRVGVVLLECVTGRFIMSILGDINSVFIVFFISICIFIGRSFKWKLSFFFILLSGRRLLIWVVCGMRNREWDCGFFGELF